MAHRRKSRKSTTNARDTTDTSPPVPDTVPAGAPESTDEGPTIVSASGADDDPAADEGEDAAPEKPQIICRLDGRERDATDQEKSLQAIIEQFHQEFEIDLEDMRRDVRIACEDTDGQGNVRRRTRTVSLAVYETGTDKVPDNIIRVALVVPPSTKATEKAIEVLDSVLGGLSTTRDPVFGAWTNGADMAFRMRSYPHGQPEYQSLTDIPAPDETLADLESAERRPLRLGTSSSLLRAFKHCHDYIYGNQSMRPDRAFWQLLYLIFCKIYDEQGSRRRFFVGPTESSTQAGQQAIARRIKGLFDQVRDDEYKDVFDGKETIDLNDRVLAYVAGQLGRYSLLNTDTDAKGLAYEAITSTTLKRDQGQFFTPRNVIRMMVDMLDPQPGAKLLDPACGSGGFLVMALAHARRQLLARITDCPDKPVPLELKKIEVDLKRYARQSLYGIDVDPDLKKVARMNMVMNNDGHGNIHCFNSLEYGVAERRAPAMDAFEKSGGGHRQFDFVVTNPPFGAKITITDPAVLETYDLGHNWTLSDGTWVRGGVQRKVAPEVLFIESCYKFLKPGTGVMALVVPNGILGNPGQQMEAVRWWLLRKMELLASVDLPGEAFLPQVSVQASCVFLRRRDEAELALRGGKAPPQGPVFMAIADRCGHGRRGEERYVRQPDGKVRMVWRDVIERWEKGGAVQQKKRRQQERELDDDMPWIAVQYRKFAAKQKFEEER